MVIRLPSIACVLLHGTAHAPVLALARRLFSADEILDMHEAPHDALVVRVAKRAAAGLTTAIVEGGAPVGAHRLRVALASAARENYVRRFAIVLPEAVRVEPRIDARLKADGYREVVLLDDAGVAAARLAREPMPTDQRHQAGPFDIVGDVHGCADELQELMRNLGYRVDWEGSGSGSGSGSGGGRRAGSRFALPAVAAPPGRRMVFVGDLVDRGPRSADVLRVVLAMIRDGSALLVPGNHDVKFLRWLDGQKPAITHGLDATVASLDGAPPEFLAAVRATLAGLWSHLWLDGGRLAVAHAGILEPMLGRATPRVRHFCLYGDTSGEKDAKGLPVRYNWAAGYRGETAIVYGHTPIETPAWQNNTLCIDTGCCFGYRLTALRWPERDIVSVPARATYTRLLRALGHPPDRGPATPVPD